MGKLMNRNDSYEDKKCDQSYVPMSPTVSSTSPLDLSKTGRPFFVTQTSSTSPLDLSMKPRRINDRQMSVDNLYEPPQIITQPKSEWHYRSAKDLANNHLPLLAGNGPQRTPIRVKVPMISGVPMYLAIAVMTIDNESHPSKVIVPAKTRVDPAHLSHDNNLHYLQFDENSTDRFEADSGCIYSKISSQEHAAQCKDVRVHMFNLYQSQSITKEMIVAKQLTRCKLSFWLCIRNNEEFIPVSQPTYSVMIEEKKMSSRPRTSQQINKPTVLPISHPFYCVGYMNQDDTFDDDDSC